MIIPMYVVIRAGAGFSKKDLKIVLRFIENWVPGLLKDRAYLLHLIIGSYNNVSLHVIGVVFLQESCNRRINRIVMKLRILLTSISAYFLYNLSK